MQDLLFRSKQSAITIKVVNLCEIEVLLRGILARRKQSLKDKMCEQGKLKTVMLGLQNLLMSNYDTSSLQILNKDNWDRKDIAEAKSLIGQSLKFRDLSALLGEVLLHEIEDEKKQREEVSQLESLLGAPQDVPEHQELRLRLTPVRLPAQVRVRNLDLRPGERQVRVTRDHIYIETVTNTDPIELALLKKSRKVAQDCYGGPGYPGGYRVLTLRNEDLEPEPAGDLSEPLPRD